MTDEQPAGATQPTADAARALAVREEYERRRAAGEAAALAERSAELRLANRRLGVFVVALVILVLATTRDEVGAAWLLLPLVGFVSLVVAHDRTRRRRARATRATALYVDGLSRLDGRCPETASTGERFKDAAHPYSGHLDLFGAGSLFQWLSRARTAMGEERLADWLRAPAVPSTVRERQQAVAELAPRVDLRERLALLGDDEAEAVEVDALARWGTAPSPLPVGLAHVASMLLPALSVLTLLAWYPGGQSVLPFLAVAAVQALFWRSVGPRYIVALRAAQVSASSLGLLRDLLAELGQEEVTAPALSALRERLRARGGAAEAIHSLARRLEWAEAAQNQFFAPIALLLLWPAWWARSVESWRAVHGPHIADWVDALADYEALVSLSGHAHENPADPFPELVEEGLLCEAVGAAHPLLPRDRAVGNDVTVAPDRRVHVISGSNMSGKSTLLRTVGTNVVLALAGAPVRARSLRLSPLQVAASIHVHDSLLDGESRFYAEVSRIGQVVDLARASDIPVLFLLDEIFHGTNSHDRRLGAAEVVRVLLEVGAAGFLTTHDLELARLAEDLDASVVNVHFEDRFEDGKMSFDYRMRPGVVTRSNALALMRAVGLEV